MNIKNSKINTTEKKVIRRMKYPVKSRAFHTESIEVNIYIFIKIGIV